MPKVTINTIAQECNVSVGTVDRALNSRGRINPETQRRILEAADRLGYRRNKLASALGRQRKYRIAVLCPRVPEYFFSIVEEGIREAQKDMMDYGFTIDQFYTNFLNFEEQEAALAQINQSQYDGLVLTASSERLAESLNRFVKAGIPVVTFNSDARDSDRLFFVGEDAYKSGRLCGTLMGRMLGGKGRVATLVSYLTPGSPGERLRGFIDAMRDAYPEIELLPTQEYLEREDLAAEQIGQITAQHGPLSGVFANSASGTVGIGRYYSQHAVEKKPLLMGYDITAEVGAYLRDGVCDIIVDQNPQKQSYYGVTLLCKHLMENWTPKVDRFEIRVKLVMRDNVEDYLPECNRDQHILL